MQLRQIETNQTCL